MTLEFYFNGFSQPSRAVHATLLLDIDMMKGETRTPEYTVISPAQFVPAIKEGDFTLFESHAILRYLAHTRPSLNQYYPQDPQRRALVDSYLDWHHLGTRRCAYFVRDFFVKVIRGLEPPTNKAERLEEVDTKLAFVESFFLGGEKKYKYIGNQPNLTFADISAYSEIINLQFINYDFSKFPNIQAWIENISNIPEIKTAQATHTAMVKQMIPDLNEFNRKIVEQ